MGVNETGRNIFGQLTEDGRFVKEQGFYGQTYASFLITGSGGGVAGGKAFFTFVAQGTRLVSVADAVAKFDMTVTTKSFSRTEV